MRIVLADEKFFFKKIVLKALYVTLWLVTDNNPQEIYLSFNTYKVKPLTIVHALASLHSVISCVFLLEFNC